MTLMCYSDYCYKSGIRQKMLNIHENPYFP